MCPCNNEPALEFLVARGEKSANGAECLLKVCCEASVGVSTGRRWVRRNKEAEVGGAELHDKPRSGRPCTAVKPENVRQVNEPVRGDCRVADEL